MRREISFIIAPFVSPGLGRGFIYSCLNSGLTRPNFCGAKTWAGKLAFFLELI